MKIIDKDNEDMKWTDTGEKNMKNCQVVFEVYEGKITRLQHDYQEITVHLFFDEKTWEKFWCEARYCAYGHEADVPLYVT